MNEKIRGLIERENTLYRSWAGSIPEANTELNNLQREKINAFYLDSGTAYIGKINYHGDERKNSAVENVLTLYTGDIIYNFGVDYIIPTMDNNLAIMIVEWNSTGLPTNLSLIDKITHRIKEIGGLQLTWS